jgi:hypothetical protein
MGAGIAGANIFSAQLFRLGDHVAVRATLQAVDYPSSIRSG